MRYIITLILAILGLSLIALAPLGVHASAVSGESRTTEKTRLSPEDMRRSALEEKIRDLKLTIANLDISISYVEKKLTIAKKAKVNITPYAKKIQSLTQEKKKQKKALIALEKKLIEMK